MRMLSRALCIPGNCVTTAIRRKLPARRTLSVSHHHHHADKENSRRNPILAAAIREGLPLLQETAAKIQASPLTRQALEATDAQQQQALEDESPKRRYMQHHIRTAAVDCLEEHVLQQQQQEAIGDWSVQGEPMEIVAIRLSSSLQHAVLYWTLPRSLAETAHIDDLLELQQVLAAQWNTTRLVRAIQAKLLQRWPRTPALRLEPATPDMMILQV